jgi:putative tricarboxylic transport membrane protein
MSITNKITVKRAEIVVAVILALCSVALMYKSAQNRITWNTEENMGAGFLPFYLSMGMFVCTVLTIIKFFLKKSPQSQNNEPFIDAEAFKFVAVTIVSLIVLVFAISYLGIYFSLVFFLAFYLRYFSDKSKVFISIFAILTPILTFLFFEWVLKIPLPQGVSEPLFYPVYDFMYS